MQLVPTVFSNSSLFKSSEYGSGAAHTCSCPYTEKEMAFPPPSRENLLQALAFHGSSGLSTKFGILRVTAINRSMSSTNYLALQLALVVSTTSINFYLYLQSLQLAWEAWATVTWYWSKHCQLISVSACIVRKFTNHFIFIPPRLFKILEISHYFVFFFFFSQLIL